MALCKKCLQVVDGVGLKILLEHVEAQLNIVVAVFFTQFEIFLDTGVFLAGRFVVTKFEHDSVLLFYISPRASRSARSFMISG